jgi:hypothetical protein
MQPDRNQNPHGDRFSTLHAGNGQCSRWEKELFHIVENVIEIGCPQAQSEASQEHLEQ